MWDSHDSENLTFKVQIKMIYKKWIQYPTRNKKLCWWKNYIPLTRKRSRNPLREVFVWINGNEWKKSLSCQVHVIANKILIKYNSNTFHFVKTATKLREFQLVRNRINRHSVQSFTIIKLWFGHCLNSLKYSLCPLGT